MGHDGSVPEVSRREAEVLAALGGRLTNAEIAAALHISVRTVESHVSSLLRKYGVGDRLALADLAKPDGAGPPVPAIAGLPRHRTSFVGRAHERDAVLASLTGTRLVTLVGPGGVGKTRLAAVVAEAFPAGGAFVDLAPVREGYVAHAVAATLGVAESSGRSLDEAIAQRLCAGPVLLVLDNCEHLLDAVAGLVEPLLSACPALTVLGTSRERLGVMGERTIPIAPLPLASDAEALFYDRARAADPAFDAGPAIVADLCARLDGLPLAIELTAARCASLGGAGLLTAVDDTLRLVAHGRGQDRRHRSLRDVVGWSYDLLDEEERALFRRLAVFSGRFDLPAATAVAGLGGAPVVADVLGRLTDKSLTAYQHSPVSRWRLLETVRAFALDQLEATGELAATRERHLVWAHDTIAELEAGLPEVWAFGGWAERFDAVADDLRAALAGAPPGPGPVAHRLARSLGHLTYARRFLHESLELYRTAARHAPTPAEAARDLHTASCAVFAVGRACDAFDLRLEAAEQARAAGDHNLLAALLAEAVVTVARFPSGFPKPVPPERLRALRDEADAAGDPDDPVVAAHLAIAHAWRIEADGLTVDPAAHHTAHAAARRVGDPLLVSASLDAAGILATRNGQLRHARDLARERMALLSDVDHRHPAAASEILDTFHVAWLSAFTVGDLPAARAAAELAVHDDLLGQHPYRPASKLVPTLVLLGRLDEAIERSHGMLDGWHRAGSPPAAWLAPAMSAVALAHGLRGDHEGEQAWRTHAAKATEGASNPAFARASASFAAFVDLRLAIHRTATSEAHRHDAATDEARHETATSAAHHETTTDAARHETATSAAHHETTTDAAHHGTATSAAHHETTTDAAHHETTTGAAHHGTATSAAHHETATGAGRHWDADTGEPRHLDPATGGPRLRESATHEARLLVAWAFAEPAHGWHGTYTWPAAAELAVVAGLPDAAERLAAAAPAAEESDWARAVLARAAGRLRRDPGALAASVGAWQGVESDLELACTLLLLPERAADGRDTLARLGVAVPATVDG
jgi:predicted ATPase/DNA-binding CsgD family transcriptional regulator